MSRRTESHLGRWEETFKRAMREGGLQAVELVARYILIVNTPSDTLPRLQQQTARVLGGRAEEVVVTAGERLIEQGRIEGRQEGHRRGEAAGTARTLLRMLTLKFGDVPPNVREAIEAADLATLERWTERIFAAERPEDLIR